MIYLNYYCTDLMFQVVMVYVIYSLTVLSLIIFNSPLVFKISLLFASVEEECGVRPTGDYSCKQFSLGKIDPPLP